MAFTPGRGAKDLLPKVREKTMGQAITTIVSALLIAAYILAVLSVLSTLLFLVGLWRFIRYEKQLAKNWNWLRDHREQETGTGPRPQPVGSRPRSAVSGLPAGNMRRTSG
jgi:hypothetical protein